MRALYLLLGDPVAHSKSPAIHARAFDILGVDAVYAPCKVADAGRALEAARILGAAGFNVTVPHKEAAARAVDRIHPSAARIGAVNCAVREGDSFTGHNTDASGFLRALRAHGLSPDGVRAVIVGAGGSARAVAWALVPHASQITILNRTESKARALAALVQAGGGARAETGPLDATAALGDANLVVQCTSIGLGSEAMAFNPSALKRDCVLVDLVYAPGGPTALLRGYPGPKVDGIDVLVHQAIASLEIWLGRPQLDSLAVHLREAALA